MQKSRFVAVLLRLMVPIWAVGCSSTAKEEQPVPTSGEGPTVSHAEELILGPDFLQVIEAALPVVAAWSGEDAAFPTKEQVQQIGQAVAALEAVEFGERLINRTCFTVMPEKDGTFRSLSNRVDETTGQESDSKNKKTRCISVKNSGFSIFRVFKSRSLRLG